MSTSVWITIGVIFIVVWGWIAYEVYNAPLMPDDYDTPWGKKTKNEKNKKTTN